MVGHSRAPIGQMLSRKACARAFGSQLHRSRRALAAPSPPPASPDPETHRSRALAQRLATLTDEYPGSGNLRHHASAAIPSVAASEYPPSTFTTARACDDGRTDRLMNQRLKNIRLWL